MARRIPSLDGLRTLSILAVLAGHLAGGHGVPAWFTAGVRQPYVDIAHLGVRVFFVISGFLITGLLLTEQDRTGRISLPRFYLRRTMRIFPAYFALLGVLALLTAAQIIQVPAANFAHAVTYTVNYDAHRVWQVGHLWSLAVEEQFYLLWPAALVLAGTRQRAIRVALAVVCIAPLVRVALASAGHLTYIGNSFETTSDALAMGCLLALSRDEWMRHSWYASTVASRWVAPALLGVGLAVSLRYRPGLLIGETLINAAIVLGIDRSVRRPHGAFGTLLNWGPMVYVGGLSYSLYLWQQLFLNRESGAAFARFPLNVALAAGCALVSYYMVEQPVLRLRPRVEARLVARRAVQLPQGWRWPLGRLGRHHGAKLTAIATQSLADPEMVPETVTLAAPAVEKIS